MFRVTLVTGWTSAIISTGMRLRRLDRRRFRGDKAGHENGTLPLPEHYSLAFTLAWPFSSPDIPR
jgi:hypothetical protein